MRKQKSNLLYTRLIPFRVSRVNDAYLRGFAPDPTLKIPSALLLNVGCNDQVFPPKPWKKKIHADSCSRLREKPLNSDTLYSQKMTSLSRRLLPTVITS